MTIGPTIKLKSFFRANGDLIIVIPKGRGAKKGEENMVVELRRKERKALMKNTGCPANNTKCLYLQNGACKHPRPRLSIITRVSAYGILTCGSSVRNYEQEEKKPSPTQSIYTPEIPLKRDMSLANHAK